MLCILHCQTITASVTDLGLAGMIAGGTGVTPMYQVAKAILKDATDKTQISLLFANVSADDILIEDLLSELQTQSPQFKVRVCLQTSSSNNVFCTRLPFNLI